MDMIAILFSVLVLIWIIAMLAAGPGSTSLDRHDAQHPNNKMDGVDQIRLHDEQKRKKTE